MKFITTLFSILYSLCLLFLFWRYFFSPRKLVLLSNIYFVTEKTVQIHTVCKFILITTAIANAVPLPSSSTFRREGPERYRAGATPTVLFRLQDVTVFWTNKSLQCRAIPTTCYCFRRHHRVVRCNNTSHPTETTNVTPTSSKFHTEQRMTSIELSFGNYTNGYVSCLWPLSKNY